MKDLQIKHEVKYEDVFSTESKSPIVVPGSCSPSDIKIYNSKLSTTSHTPQTMSLRETYLLTPNREKNILKKSIALLRTHNQDMKTIDTTFHNDFMKHIRPQRQIYATDVHNSPITSPNCVNRKLKALNQKIAIKKL